MKRTPALRKTTRTAWGLLNQICQLIEQEPLRYNQSDWINLVEDAGYDSAAHFPDCGTIGCVAGWVATLVDGRKAASLMASNFNIGSRARKLLGLTRVQAIQLFEGAAMNQLADVFGFDSTPLKGSSEYAALGVAHIHRFMHKHEAQLRRKRVVRG